MTYICRINTWSWPFLEIWDWNIPAWWRISSKFVRIFSPLPIDLTAAYIMTRSVGFISSRHRIVSCCTLEKVTEGGISAGSFCVCALEVDRGVVTSDERSLLRYCEIEFSWFRRAFCQQRDDGDPCHSRNEFVQQEGGGIIFGRASESKPVLLLPVENLNI